MKTTVDIDTDLLAKARQILGTATIKDTVDRSFEAVIRQQALACLADAAGTVDLELTAEGVRRQRRTRGRRVSR
jgi:Arc/MetJ family transcription regulator